MPHVITDTAGNPQIDESGNILVSNKFDKVLFMDQTATADKVTIPHHSSLDFGIQDNFSISTWVALTIPSSFQTRWNLFNKRSNPSGATVTGYDLFMSQISVQQYRIVFICTATGTGNQNAITFDILEDLRGQWIHIILEKYNSNPASSVSNTEWKLTVRGQAVTPTADIASNTLTPSSNIKNTVPALINARDRSLTSPALADVPATMYQGPITIFNNNSRALTTAEKDYLAQNDGLVPESAKSLRVFDAPLNDNGGTVFTDKSSSANNGTLSGFANTTAGNPSNAWKIGFTLAAA